MIMVSDQRRMCLSAGRKKNASNKIGKKRTCQRMRAFTGVWVFAGIVATASAVAPRFQYVTCGSSIKLGKYVACVCVQKDGAPPRGGGETWHLILPHSATPDGPPSDGAMASPSVCAVDRQVSDLAECAANHALGSVTGSHKTPPVGCFTPHPSLTHTTLVHLPHAWAAHMKCGARLHSHEVKYPSGGTSSGQNTVTGMMSQSDAAHGARFCPPPSFRCACLLARTTAGWQLACALTIGD